LATVIAIAPKREKQSVSSKPSLRLRPSARSNLLEKTTNKKILFDEEKAIPINIGVAFLFPSFFISTKDTLLAFGC